MAKTTEKPASTYTREQICTSERFRADRDILTALLVSGQTYTLAEIEKKLRDFKQTKIKEQINGGER
ncbi:hypothetical protein [Sporomusa paucivorans]|uniref:hypothetical protein n=1 Tax=Sporomusa paucivorans TaxID=2376 RepID=UPI003570E370